MISNPIIFVLGVAIIFARFSPEQTEGWFALGALLGWCWRGFWNACYELMDKRLFASLHSFPAAKDKE